jgi:uncharacterized protein (TIGR02265 family)
VLVSVLASARPDPELLVEEHLAKLPKGAAGRGHFFQGTLSYVRKLAPDVDLAKAAGLAQTRYVGFTLYPYADFVRLAVAGAQVLEPGSTAEGLRALGTHAYDTLLESQFGRVILGAFGKNFDHVVMSAARVYSVSLNFGKVDVERVATGHVRFEFRAMPAFLETFQRGAFEGGMKACGVEGEVVVTSRDVANATFDVRWR